MSTPGTNPPSSNVQDPKQHTDGGAPTRPGGVDVNAGADAKLTTPASKPAK